MAGNTTGGSLIDDAKLKQLYATMLQCRLLTEHARRLRNPRRALYSASLGQEAIATGCAIDLRPEDTVALAPRDSIAALVKGVALGDIVAEIYARGRHAANPAHNILLPSPTAGEQLQRANHVALANKQQNNSNVVVAFTTTEATSLDGWHEALNFAVRRSLPIIFVVENNPWHSVRNGIEDLALNSRRNGLTTIAVDGNDVVAVYRVAYESLERVRQGGGPVMVEGRRYHQDGEAWRRTERDPLTHMERYLTAKTLFTTRWKNQLVHQFSRELDAAVKKVDVAVKATRYLRASQPVAND
jgi:TPP-dependent pyruvate/acetoin dehydrogenase alpha subunit